MILHSVHLRNFRLHADTYIELPAHGLIGLIGSNESGKSSVLEGVEWCFFGGTATRGTKGGLRWNGAPKVGAGAAVKFGIGGTTYLLDRTESNAKLIDTVTGDIVAEGTDAVNKFMPTLLGMGLTEFRSSFLCSQKDLNRIASYGPTERQAFIRRVLGHERIDDALKACRKGKAQLADEIRGLEAGMGPRDPYEIAIVEARKNETECIDLVNDGRIRYEDTKAEHTAALAEVSGYATVKEEYDRIKRDMELAERDYRKASEGHVAVEARLIAIEVAESQVAELEPQLAELPTLRSAKDVAVRANASAAERTRLIVNRDSITRAIEGLFERQPTVLASATTTPQDVDALRKELAHATARLNDLRTERTSQYAIAIDEGARVEKEIGLLGKKIAAIEKAGDSGACPTCLRALGEAFATVIEALNREIGAKEIRRAEATEFARSLSAPSWEEDEWSGKVPVLEEKIRSAERANVAIDRALTELDVLTADIEKNRIRLKEVEDRLAELPEVEAVDISDIEAKIAELEELDRTLVGIRSKAGQRADTEAERDRLAGEIEAAADRRDRAANRIQALGYDTEAHAKAAAHEASVKQALDEARVAFVRSEEALKAANAHVVRTQKAIDEYDARAETLVEAKRLHLLHETVDARLNAFRVAVAATVRPEMESLMSEFMAVLTDGRHEAVELTEDFTAIAHENGKPIEVVSGGTEDLIALAMRLALSQMIAARAGHPLSLLILDEPFGSLDEVRRGNVLGLIRKLATVFPQVITISHVDETRHAVDVAIELQFDEAAGHTRLITGEAA